MAALEETMIMEGVYDPLRIDDWNGHSE